MKISTPVESYRFPHSTPTLGEAILRLFSALVRPWLVTSSGCLLLVSCLLISAVPSPAQSSVNTINKGTPGTIPVWTGTGGAHTSTNIENTDSTQPGTVGGNLLITGQDPWVDISAFGGTDDALLNSGTTLTTAGVTTLTIGSGTSFNNTGEVGKVIAIAGGGPTAPAAAPNATSQCSANGKLVAGQVYYVKTAFIAENTTSHTFLSEGPASAEKMVTVLTCGGGTFPFINVPTPPMPPTGATAYVVYAGVTSGAEFQQSLTTNVDLTQPAVCNNATLAQSGYNACPGGKAVSLNSIFPEGPEPATVATWQTTIASFVASNKVTLTDAVLNDVTTSSAVVWGHDNVAAFNSALNSCVTGTQNATTVGCRIRFSGPSIINSVTHTGRYYMRTSPVIPGNGTTPRYNIVLAGEGGLGVTGLGGAMGFTQIRPTPEIIVGSRVWGVKVGSPANPLDTTSTISGFDIENLAFEDAIGQAFGGVALLQEVDGAFLDRTSMVNFTNGSCLYLDGGADQQLVQIATIHKIRGNSCKYGIRSAGNASDIEIDGGTLTSSQVAGGVGIDFEGNPYSGNQGTGNIRIHDIALRNFPAAHIKLVDVPASSVVQVKEENVGTAQGIGIDLESDAVSTNTPSNTPNCTGIRIAFPVITNSITGVQIGSSCKNIDIYKPWISGATTNISDSGINGSAITDEYGVTLGSGTGLATAPSGRSLNITVPNATSSGPSRKQLVQLVTSACPSGVDSCAENASAGQSNKVIGIVVANSCNADPCVSSVGPPAVTTFSVVAVSGIAVCQMDSQNPGVANTWVIPSSVAGRCHFMTGSTPPTNEYMGIVLDAPVLGNQTARVLLNIQNE